MCYITHHWPCFKPLFVFASGGENSLLSTFAHLSATAVFHFSISRNAASPSPGTEEATQAPTLSRDAGAGNSGNGFVMYLLTYNQVLKQQMHKNVLKSQCVDSALVAKFICHCEENSVTAISNSSSFYLFQGVG